MMNKTGSALSSYRISDGPKIFFATKMGSDSIGEKEDPRLVRRLKLSMVAAHKEI